MALNLTLWLAAPGLALRRALVTELFGPGMVRAQVHERNGQDWNVDRGVIRQVNPTQLTLREADGRIQQIQLAAGTTRVIRFGRRLPLGVLAPRWRVVVTWPPIGAAQSVDVERIPRRR